jgi:hypothetical protein
MNYWMVIFPRGDRTRLSIACVVDCELNDWALASERQFPNTPEGEEDCRTHMEELGKKHGLSYPVKNGYLD